MCETGNPSSWHKVKIKDIALIRRGASPRPIDDPSFFAETGRGWVRISDVSATYKTLENTEQYLSPKGVERSISVEPGQLIMSICATIGKPVISGVPSSIHDGFVLFDELSEDVDTEFLFYQLIKNQAEISKNKQIGTQGNLNTTLVNNIDLLLPPKAEQLLIAQILDTLDTAIRDTEALIDKLKAVKQGLLHDLLTRGIDANGQLRPPQSEAPQLYKESPLGWIPREWELSTVGDEFEIQLGKMLDAQKNSGAMKQYLGNKAVQWDHIDLNEVQQMALSIADMERFRLRPGDLLVCEGGDVGRAAIWEGQLDECYYQKALHRLRPVHGFSARLMLELLRYWMRRDVLFEYISKTSIAHFTQEKFASVPLPVPSTDEQNRLVSVVLAHKQRQEQEEDALKKLMEEKQGLMDDLLTGRVRVTPLLESVQQAAAQTGA